jgi:hypothetical protein
MEPPFLRMWTDENRIVLHKSWHITRKSLLAFDPRTNSARDFELTRNLTSRGGLTY